MADNEDTKNEDENNNTFGKFDNRFTRGAFAAVIAAYAAKKDPYLLKGFAEKMDEYEKADEARRLKFVEASTAAATKEIARNKLRRQERVNEITPELKAAVANEMNPYKAGKAYETGQLKTIIALKSKYPKLELDTFYEVAKDLDGKIGDFTFDDIKEALAGATIKTQKLIDDVKGPKRTSPLGNFIRGNDSDDNAIKDEINARIEAQNKEIGTDSKPVDFSKVTLSKEGARIIKAASSTNPYTATNIAPKVASFTATMMSIGRDGLQINNSEFVFNSNDAENNAFARKVTTKLIGEVETLNSDPRSVAFNNREKALSIIERKYSKLEDDGTYTLDIDKVNFNEEEELIPYGWTPSRTNKDEIRRGREKDLDKKLKKENEKLDEDKKKMTKQKVLSDWEKTKKDLLEAAEGNKNNTLYTRNISIQKRAVKKQYENLGGNPNDIN